MNINRRLEKLEQTMKPPAAPFPVEEAEWGYVRVTDYAALYRLALDWMRGGVMIWKQKYRGPGFGGGPNNHPVTKEDYAQFAMVGYALEGITEKHVPALQIPQDTGGMIALLERSIA